ncbi:hypothetical protein ACFL3Y_01105 [Pseudomonadota bacterium]
MTIELQKLLVERDQLDRTIRSDLALRGSQSILQDVSEYVAVNVLAAEVRYADRIGSRVRLVRDGLHFQVVPQKLGPGSLIRTQFTWTAKPKSFDALIFIIFDRDWKIILCKTAGLEEIIPFAQQTGEPEQSWTLSHRDLDTCGNDQTDEARTFWGRLVPENLFEELCISGANQHWCWRLGCTTCKNHKVLSSLVDVARGAPIKTDYAEARRPPSLNPLERSKLARVCAAADLQKIAINAAFPDWLGIMGIALSKLGNLLAHDGHLRHLSDSWANQFSGMIEAGSMAESRLRYLSDSPEEHFWIADLNLMEHDIRPEYKRPG